MTETTAAPTFEHPRPATLTERFEALDVVRGAIMVLMALDHVREYFTSIGWNPLDLTRTTPLLFGTRWITHLCAPIFSFAAGAGAYLSRGRGKSDWELTKFLLSRGLWLVFLELTLVQFAWFFHWNPAELGLLVLWALGASMIALAALIHLPRAAQVAVSAALICGHNLLDSIDSARLGALGNVWKLLHQSGVIGDGKPFAVFVLYPILPWIGVMGLGYACAPLMRRPAPERRPLLWRIGLALILAFVVLRATNLYGDPKPWTAQGNAVMEVLSFLDVEKYPPSLLFLLVTLGIGALLLAVADRKLGPVGSALLVFGRVPMFYYLVHLFLIHLLALVGMKYGEAPFFYTPNLPPDWGGYGLPVIYGIWAFVVLALYWPCRWYARLKQRRRDLTWLSYL